MCDFDVGDGGAVFVDAGHEGPDHVFAVFGSALGFSSTGLDDVRVHFGHCLVCSIACSFVRQW